jgi:hypothetical protein
VSLRVCSPDCSFGCVGGIASDGVCASRDGIVGGGSSGTGGIGSSNSPAGLGGGTTVRATGAL